MRIRVDKREDGIIVSTVEPVILAWYGRYETAIIFENEAIRICEGYKTLEEAIKGHIKYLNMSLEDIFELDFIG